MRAVGKSDLQLRGAVAGRKRNSDVVGMWLMQESKCDHPARDIQLRRNRPYLN